MSIYKKNTFLIVDIYLLKGDFDVKRIEFDLKEVEFNLHKTEFEVQKLYCL